MTTDSADDVRKRTPFGRWLFEVYGPYRPIQMADFFGVSKQAFYGWLKGSATPSTANMLNIAKKSQRSFQIVASLFPF